jgi:hypothetical protein
MSPVQCARPHRSQLQVGKEVSIRKDSLGRAGNGDSNAGSHRSTFLAGLHACWSGSHGFSPCHASRRLEPYHRVSAFSRCLVIHNLFTRSSQAIGSPEYAHLTPCKSMKQSSYTHRIVDLLAIASKRVPVLSPVTLRFFFA